MTAKVNRTFKCDIIFHQEISTVLYCHFMLLINSYVHQGVCFMQSEFKHNFFFLVLLLIYFVMNMVYYNTIVQIEVFELFIFPC